MEEFFDGPRWRVRVHETGINGLLVFDQNRYADDRGDFGDLRFNEVAKVVGRDMVPRQTNISRSNPRVVRGMHGEPMWKIVSVVSGQAIAAWVDARVGYPTFGQVVRLNLSGPGTSVFVPAGVLNGFGVVGSDQVVYSYAVELAYPDIPSAGKIAVNPLSEFPGYKNGLFPEIVNPVVSARDSTEALSWGQFVARKA